MSAYGVFATLAGTITSLVAVSGAILLGFKKRSRWQPPEEAVPAATSRIASLLTCVGVALLYVFADDMARWVLGALTVGLFVVTLVALLTAMSVNIQHGYYYPAAQVEKNRKLGGDVLTVEAEGIRTDKRQTSQQMFEDAKGKKDLVWTRKSQAAVSRRSTLSFIALIGGGGCCLAAAGMLVTTSIRKSGDPNLQSGVQAAPGRTVQLDLLAALNVLRYVPQKNRGELCPSLMSKDDCARAAPMIASLAYQMPTEQQGETIRGVFSRGNITASEAKELVACGGAFDFKVIDFRLVCADGTPLPVLATSEAGTPLESESAIVLHATATSAAMPFGGVVNFIAHGTGPLKGPLAHLIVSRNGAIAQTTPFNQKANHVGQGAVWQGHMINNQDSIGIEMISTGDYANDPYSATQLKATSGVVAALMKAYNISSVVGHSDIAPGRKTDPGPGVVTKIRMAVGLPAE